MKEFTYREALPIKGKNIVPRQTGRVEYFLERARKRSAKELPNERKKSPEQLLQIQLINAILEKELSSLGVTGFGALLPEQFHFLEEKEFAKYRSYQLTDVAGSYMASEDSIHILYNPDDDINPCRSYIDWKEITDRVIDKVLEEVPSPDDDTGAEYQERNERTDRLIEEELERLGFMEEHAFHAVHFYRLFGTMLHEALHAVGAQHVHLQDERYGVKSGYHIGGLG